MKYPRLQIYWITKRLRAFNRRSNWYKLTDAALAVSLIVLCLQLTSCFDPQGNAIPATVHLDGISSATLDAIKGDKGDTGAAGADGAAGAKGDKGDTGDTGAAGSKGDKGDTGAAGAKGDKGDTGDTGAAGAKGDKGDTGATGAKGDKGDTGAAGAKGDKGDTGAAGASYIAPEPSYVYSVRSGSGGGYYYEVLSDIPQYTIQSGDYLEYDIYQCGTNQNIGIDFDIANSGPTNAIRDTAAVDQNGLSVHSGTNISAYANGVWYHRKIAIPSSMYGGIIYKWIFAYDGSTAGQKKAYFKNIQITNGAGTIRFTALSGNENYEYYTPYNSGSNCTLNKLEPVEVAK